MPRGGKCLKMYRNLEGNTILNEIDGASSQ